MPEKAKNKRGEQREVTKKSIFVMTGIILSPVIFIVILFLLQASAWLRLVLILCIITLIIIAGWTIISLIIQAFRGETQSRRIAASLLLLVIAGLVVSGIVLLSFWFSFLLAPLFLIALGINILIILVRETAYEKQLQTMRVVTLGFVFNVMLLVTYTLVFMNIHGSIYVDGRSYHIISARSPFDPSSFRLHECNLIGMGCQSTDEFLYAYGSPDFTFEIMSENSEQRSLIVYRGDEVLYQHPID